MIIALKTFITEGEKIIDFLIKNYRGNDSNIYGLLLDLMQYYLKKYVPLQGQG